MTQNTSLNNRHCSCYDCRHQFAPPLLRRSPPSVCTILGVSLPTSSKREKGGSSPASRGCVASRMLSAAKKRRVTPSNSSFNSDDDGDPPAIAILQQTYLSPRIISLISVLCILFLLLSHAVIITSKVSMSASKYVQRQRSFGMVPIRPLWWRRRQLKLSAVIKILRSLMESTCAILIME